MEDRLLKFAQVVDAGSFTKAAAKLHISQPALSMAIGQLEKQLGAVLLVRQARPLRMTGAGRRAYEAAKDIAMATDNMTAALHELNQSKRHLTAGMVDSVAQTVLRDDVMLAAVETVSHLNLIIDNSRALQRMVEYGELDVAFAVESDEPISANLVSLRLGAEPMLLVCRQDLVWDARRQMASGHIEDFISYDQRSLTSRLVRHALRRTGVTYATRIHSTSPDIMLRLVCLGKGLAALPASLAVPHITTGDLVAMDLPIQRPIVRLLRRRQQPDHPLELLSQHVRDGLQSA